MKKMLVFLLVIVMSLTVTLPAYASSYSNGWNGGEKLNFNPLSYHSVYSPSDWSKDLVNKYGLTWYENPTRLALKGEVMLVQLRTIQASLKRQGYNLLSANGETLANFNDKDSLVPAAQEEVKILKAIGILSGDYNSYMRLDSYITRAEVAKIVAVTNQSVLGISERTGDNTFTDIANSWAKDYISHVYKIGVMDGITSSRFYPDNSISIEQILDILDNEVGYYGITLQDVATAMNETFKVTYNLDTTRISAEHSSYSIKTNETIAIKVNVYPYTSRDLEFICNDTSVCQIYSINQYTDTITVKGIKAGTTYVKASISGMPNVYTTIPIYVTANEVPATGITVTGNVTVKAGYVYYLTTSVLPSNATNKTVKYYSDDTSIAKVNSDGKITGVSKGVTVITAQTHNGYQARTIVTVTSKTISATGITITNNASIEAGYVYYLTTSVLPYNASDKTVKYYSDDTSIAKVNSDGKVTGVSKGVTVITAKTHNGYKAYCVVTVTQKTIPVNAITVTNNLTLKVAERYYLTASVSPYNATDKTIKYYSDDTNIASVNSNGRITGVNKGVTVITVESHNGYKAYCVVTVNNSDLPNGNTTNNERSFMYVNGYGESSYYNAYNNESMTFIVDTNFAINDITLSNDNCYISQSISNNVNGWQFTVNSRTLSQNGETLLTVKLSNGEQLTVKICIYP